MAQKVEAQGGIGGTVWDDGVHDGVRKVHVGQGQDGVAFFQAVYLRGSEEVDGGERGKETLLGHETFEVDADDFIIGVQVTHDRIFGQEYDIVTSLTFFTSKGVTSPPFGLETEKKVMLKGTNGSKLIGFHGLEGDNIIALGAYFVTASTPLTPGEKLPALGGDQGTVWDDGAFDGVKKVFVGQAQDGIAAVKFVYDQGSEDFVGEHGNSTLLGYEEFELDYPSEYITAVEGTYDKIFGSESVIITMLRFKTNKQTSGPFGLEAGTPFVLQKEGNKIVGFHGKVSDLLHQFGVHVTPITN